MNGLGHSLSIQVQRVFMIGGRLVLLRLVVSWMALSQILGCVPSGEYVPVEIRQGEPILTKTLSESERLRVAVIPFEDRRADTGRIGTRYHRLGGETAVTIKGGTLGDILAEVFVEYLKKRHGWHAWIAKPGVAPPDEGPDITLSGAVTVFEADAVPGFGGTRLRVTSVIQLKARHSVDRPTIDVTCGDTETLRPLWFEWRDLEALINATVQSNAGQFMSQTIVEDRGLSVK